MALWCCLEPEGMEFFRSSILMQCHRSQGALLKALDHEWNPSS